MKKLATIKAMPLAAATFITLAGAAPVSAAAAQPNGTMPPMPMSGDMTIMHPWMMQMPHAMMPLDMAWAMPMQHVMHMQQDSTQAEQGSPRGVVDDFAATITVVHAQVQIAQSSSVSHQSTDQEVDSVHTPSHDTTWQAPHDTTHETEHAESDDCLKDDQSHADWQAHHTNWSDGSDKSSESDAWSNKSDADSEHSYGEHGSHDWKQSEAYHHDSHAKADYAAEWKSEDEDCAKDYSEESASNDWSHEDSWGHHDQAHDEWTNHSADKQVHAMAYAHDDESEDKADDCVKAYDDCQKTDDCE